VTPHFTIFRVPVHVQPFFWLLTAMFGFSQYGTASPLNLALWFPIVFTAILFHELGHALVGRAFGATPFVILTGMGGLTQLHGQRFTPGRAAIVSFAGPLVGLTIGGGTLLYRMFSPTPLGLVAQNALGDVVWTNLGWAIFNLIPIVGLDGGNIMAALLDKGFGAGGVRAAHVLSIFVAVGLAAALMFGYAAQPESFGNRPPIFTVMIFGFFALHNYRAWQAQSRWSDRIKPMAPGAGPRTPQGEREGPSEARIDQEIERGFRALEDRNATLVRSIAESLLPHVRTSDQRFQVGHLLAWGRLLSGDPSGARRALVMLPPGQRPDALLEGAIELELGRAAEAVPALTEAIVDRNDDFVATRLARAVAASGRVDPLLALLHKDAATQVGARPFQIVASELAYANKHDEARKLGEALFERFHEGADAFNVACALSKLDRAQGAIEWLEKAIEAGLPDKTVLDTDADIASVRALPEFAAIREKAGLVS
jgi:Zn-dependent protease/tetratricopeptide (TPR) repeat protein